MSPRRDFGAAEIERLRAMERDGKRGTAIAAALGRSEHVVRRKLRELRGLPRSDAYAGKPAGGDRELYEHTAKPSVAALAEREARLALQPRDLTAAFCGDPLPGRSALDRRGEGAR